MTGRKRLPALKVDAFGGEPYGGNPAGVVLDAQGLTERKPAPTCRSTEPWAA